MTIVLYLIAETFSLYITSHIQPTKAADSWFVFLILSPYFKRSQATGFYLVQK